MNSKAIRKQLLAAVAMVLVAAVALGSSTYAWFVSNNSVEAATTNISAQSNSAYLLIDTVGTTATSTTSAGSNGSDTPLYPTTWANTFDQAGKKAGEEGFDNSKLVYQFESAYATHKDAATENTETRFIVGNAGKAVNDDYAIENIFYVGTGPYDGQFKDLKVTNVSVSDPATNTVGKDKYTVLADSDPSYDETGHYAYLTAKGTGANAVWIGKTAYEALDNTSVGTQLANAMRVLVYNTADNWVVWSKNGRVSSSDTDDIIYTSNFGKNDGGDVTVHIFVYYEGSDDAVYTTNLANLTSCGVTVTFEATPTEYGKSST